MIESLGTRVLLACLLQFLLHILFYGQPFPFLVLEILFAVVALANTAALVSFSYQAFQRQRPVLGLVAATAAFPALLLGGILLSMMLSK
ncbi:hypothetical protein GCM10023185_37670 [Hymenobacter saemangeumensis]|uniref:Uncharacterized protein n=1 Tax=Hymenobacter saemangeumensis TaxID=1084522 RepID=A0ABP8IQ90_9BACT